jgi:hypothetical protein
MLNKVELKFDEQFNMVACPRDVYIVTFLRLPMEPINKLGRIWTLIMHESKPTHTITHEIVWLALLYKPRQKRTWSLLTGSF